MYYALQQISLIYIVYAVKEVEEPELVKGTTILDQPPSLRLRPWQWWILVTLNITFLLIGQCGAVILGRFYYDQGGTSKWMATLVQTAAFPIFYIPFFFFPSPKNLPVTTTAAAILDRPSIPMLSLIYFFLGALLAGDNMLYSIGLLYLPVSTYSLICTTQLAFNAIFSFFINSQKLTPWIINSLVLLTLSASLVAVNSDPTEHKGVSKGKYALGFICTLGASTCYSLLLSLMQLSFEKVLKRETLSVVLEMQIYTSLVATFISIGGLFASGEWRDLRDEMESFKEGRVLYFMALVGASLAWQVSSIGVVGLIFVVSSLFANVISTLALPLVPVAAVLFYRETMNGAKVVAMLLAIWGFAWYLYQHYLDGNEPRVKEMSSNEVFDESSS